MRFLRPLRPAIVAAALMGLPVLALAQQRDGLLSGNIKYNSGMSIQPIYEGWTRNPDGSYQIHFGYLNRNHVEELAIPVGPDNKIEPGGPDRGQPTYFYTRFNRQLFSVTVPADFGKKEVIWTVTANGQTEKAVGWLRPDWEIAPPGTGMGTGRGGDSLKNQPPKLAVDAAGKVGVGAALTLTSTVTDDGLPPARPNRGRGRAGLNRPPAFDNSDFKATTPTNVPQVERPLPPRVDGRLQVSWFVWRGPAAATFTPPAASADQGPAAVTATFTKPGDYVLRARATDGMATVTQDVKVTVGP